MTANQKRLYEAWTEFGRRLIEVLAALEEERVPGHRPQGQ
jgi:hypothetical protein